MLRAFTPLPKGTSLTVSFSTNKQGGWILSLFTASNTKGFSTTQNTIAIFGLNLRRTLVKLPSTIAMAYLIVYKLHAYHSLLWFWCHHVKFQFQSMPNN